MSVIHFGLAFVYWTARRYDQAISECEKAIELDPKSVQANLWMGLSYSAKLMYEPAIAAMRRALEHSQNTSVVVGCLGEAYAAAGYCEEAQRMLQDLSKRRHVTAYFVSRIYAALNKKDEALQWLETAYRTRGEWVVLLQTDPRFDDLRSDQRFQDLLHRMNFPT